MTEGDPVVLGVQQIIQKIEGINSKKSSPLVLRRKSQPKAVINCGPTRNSTPPAVCEFYEPTKRPAKTAPASNGCVCGSRSFRQSR